MRRNILYHVLFFIILMCVPNVFAQDDLLDEAKNNAVAALIDRFDEGNGVIYVYRDFSISMNHFTQKAKMFGRIENAVHDMDENWKEDLRSGQSAIRCEIDVPSDDWGGWLFLNGYLPAGEGDRSHGCRGASLLCKRGNGRRKSGILYRRFRV